MMLTDTGWGLVYLCWVITVGSLMATAFTLRHFFEMRRQHWAAAQGAASGGEAQGQRPLEQAIHLSRWPSHFGGWQLAAVIVPVVVTALVLAWVIPSFLGTHILQSASGIFEN